MVVRVEVAGGDAEVAADLLWQAGATAVGEDGSERGPTVLTADLDACPAAVRALARSVEVFADDGRWQDGWRPFARSVRAGPFLVRPPWVERGEADAEGIDLLLDGGRAFGTGSHPSTTLALEALADVVADGDSVLDVGCGSGALAVGAALLDAARVVAIDVDPAAVEATTANAARNGVGALVAVHLLDAAACEGTFDVVVANLGAPLVADLAATLLARLRAGGALILSGLLDERASSVVAAYDGAVTFDVRRRDGWTCLAGRRARDGV